MQLNAAVPHDLVARLYAPGKLSAATIKDCERVALLCQRLATSAPAAI